MVTKNNIFILAALMVTVPLSAMESNQSIWASMWKQSKDFVTHAVKSISEFNAHLTQNQRYVVAATVGLAAVGVGYLWFAKKSKSLEAPKPAVAPIMNPQVPSEQTEEHAVNMQQPQRIKKSVSFAEEKNQVTAIPTREILQLQQMVHDPVFMKNLKTLQEAVTADSIMINKLVSRAGIHRSILPVEIQSIKVWNNCKNYFDQFLVKNIKACSTTLNEISKLPVPTNLAQLQQLQQHLSLLTRDILLFLKRLHDALEE